MGYLSDLDLLATAMRDNHLKAARPAPIPFPVSAGVHAPHFEGSETQAVSLESQTAEMHSTRRGDERG